ncbi:MAG TPA: DUF374 domain-containing protein [Xanthobacteraceae bacterium]|nr:DUF374 domain-containing protein [Xanthobacteraceae bacterium]
MTVEAERKERLLPALLRRVSVSEAALAIGGFVTASHFRFVRWTNRVVRIPEATFDAPWQHAPAILAVWHGEHFLVPFIGPRNDRMNCLTTLHRDGEILTRAGMHFGLKFVRGSGDHGREFVRKKAVPAFTAMVRLLRRGETVVVTADVPKVARVAGLGVVTLAKHSGCPIVPVGMGTSRRLRLANWDRTCINLPFGRMVMVRGEPIRVARDADDAALEAARRTVEQRLIEVDARAYAVADGRATV